MNIVLLNSSPRTAKQSKTERMLNALVDGMRDGGAETELIHLRKKNIKHCIGCFSCWTKTPGMCVIQDDMTAELFPKWAKADLVVYGSPLYYFGFNAQMKIFVERTLPSFQPFFEYKDGSTHHPWRIKPPKAVVLSVAGFPEGQVFDLLSSWVRFIYAEELVAEIYRPAAEFLSVRGFGDKTKEVLDATRRAGKEIVTRGSVNEDTLAAITQPITEKTEMAIQMGNAMWKTCICEGVTPMEMDDRGIVPRPYSLETFMAMMTMGFKSLEAGDMRALIQFDFSGSVQESCHFRIAQGTIEAIHGKADKPDLVIEAPFDVWMDIMTGKADGQQMFMEGQYRAAGEFSILMRMGQLFDRRQ
jgi:multimeric flavodoxin WrbA